MLRPWWPKAEDGLERGREEALVSLPGQAGSQKEALVVQAEQVVLAVEPWQEAASELPAIQND